MESMSRSTGRREVKRQGTSMELGLGERLRRIRVGLEMTQSELAGDRFSKEYVSQIERGKTRPTGDTIAWLAARLSVDPGFLTSGVSTDQRDRLEAALARAEALTDSGEHDTAIQGFEELRVAFPAGGLPHLEVRALSGEGKARIRKGELREALQLLTRARAISEGQAFSDVERAQVLYLLGVCRYSLSSISTAIGLFDQALELADGSQMPSDQLRSEVLHWRSRCFVRLRDYEAARDDVERALELAQAIDDHRVMGHVYFQASLLAERDGHWVLARSYAERAKAEYEHVADRENVGKLLNNLGGLQFLLGKPAEALRHLKDAFATALEVGNDADAARAVSSMAQVHLRTGELALAEEQASHALKLLEGRVDSPDEVGNAQLVLGRALLGRGRLDAAEAVLKQAEASFAQFSSGSHRAAAWVAQGDLATHRGNDRIAAQLYRRAAEALQDVRF